eukprot:TRINITY_DN19216_c0_g1_i1.p1 TRINITY_DN19216_c0_g1~~TRINITY_DN19216_c0_g1_i1.p1  ORF type:complete len:303 (+),score=58.57 TRINITY_DN19216_c0_g1_i1:65-910(+)
MAPHRTLWVRPAEEDAAAIAVEVEGADPRVEDAARQCSEMFGGLVTLSHKGVYLEPSVHLSLLNPEVVLDVTYEQRVKKPTIRRQRTSRRPPTRDLANELCDMYSHGLDAVEIGGLPSPPSMSAPHCDDIEHLVDAAPSVGLPSVSMEADPFDLEENFSRLSFAPRTNRRKMPTSVGIVREEMKQPTRKEKICTTSSTFVTAPKRSTSVRAKTKKEPITVDQAFQTGRLNDLPASTISEFLVNHGLSGNGNKKSLITRLERFGPVLIKSNDFVEVPTRHRF